MDGGLSGITLQIKYSQVHSHGPGWSEAKNWSDFSMWNLISGSMTVESGGSRVEAGAGDTVFFCPGEWCSLTGNGECTFRITFFTMETGNMQDLLARQDVSGVYSGDRIARASAALLKAMENAGNPVLHSLRSYAGMLTFLAELTECTDLRFAFRSAEPIQPDLKMHRLLALMGQEAPRILPVRELAERMGMSEKYFITYFRQQIGCSPRQFMNRQRMHLAAKMLSDPDSTIAQTAGTMGFSDPYAFSKAFRKYYGESPGAFRTRMTAGHSGRKENGTV